MHLQGDESGGRRIGAQIDEFGGFDAVEVKGDGAVLGDDAIVVPRASSGVS